MDSALLLIFISLAGASTPPVASFQHDDSSFRTIYVRDNENKSSNGLDAGAISGIAIGAVSVLLAIIAIGLTHGRKCYMNRVSPES